MVQLTREEAAVTHEVLTNLTSRASDALFTDGGDLIRLEIVQMADGSRRWCALLTTYDATNRLEQEYRITSAPPWNAPAWASEFKAETQVRVGSDWMTLEQVDA